LALAALLPVVGSASCTIDRHGLRDRDAGPSDGPRDGGDAERDGAAPDAAPPDAGPDAGALDAATADARVTDAGRVDGCVPTDPPIEVCDGVDNDCDPRTPDGAAETGGACDGPDADACAEGTTRCVDRTLVCSDDTGDSTEACNAVDDDCDGEVDEAACDPCERRVREGSVYLFCPSTEAWPAARGACVERGYDLVTLESEAEHDFVWSTSQTIVAGEWWMGLEDMATNGVYVWVDGTTVWAMEASFGYTNWRDGEPCDDPNQACIQFDVGTGLWADHPCADPLPFVCETDMP
jgi:hypothetical protein